ncbi:limonene hydroxylase [Paenibacillus chitinolyticus]|uniref:limonene hydroxylase n=1 Tax=Paenibacillus chitinolyticus TaxID=79263 RepID=UPI00364505EE
MILSFTRAPWEGKTSIYSYIKEQGSDIDGTLPDDEEFWAGGKLRWVAGGLDGAFGHHAAAGVADEEVSGLVSLLAKQTRKPTNTKRKEIYQKLIKEDIIGQIDNVLNEIRRNPAIQAAPLFNEAQWFAEHAAHRNAVKFGIALLGLFQNEQLKDLLMTLGRHDEFTLYAAVAIQNGMENSNEILFELAKNVNGWGKIHLVERLEPNTPEIKAWLLRHGCQNSVMNEYLACICARNGELHEAISVDRVDRDLFEGATDIIQALLYGGPAEDIDDYEPAPQVTTDYVRLADEMSVRVKHLSVVLDILDFLDRDDEQWEKRESIGWTEKRRSDVRAACEAIIVQPRWTDLIQEAVNSTDSVEHYYGVACATKLGIDVWDVLYAQLSDNPMQEELYLNLMKTDEPDRVRKLVQFAEERLPLDEIAAGPGDEMGFGEAFAAHRCLGSVVQSLDRFPGTGVELIATALNSPVVNNRNMALYALEAWETAVWGDRLREMLMHLAAKETDETVKERIANLVEERGL